MRINVFKLRRGIVTIDADKKMLQVLTYIDFCFVPMVFLSGMKQELKIHACL